MQKADLNGIDHMMQIRRIMCLVALTTSLILGLSTSSVGQRAAVEQAVSVSYVCPMDADVLAEQPGTCPICKMDLQAVRIETAWSCPTHAAVVKSEAGQCEFDHRDLVPVTINHFWVCPDHDKVLYPALGKCGDGRPREERKVVRAHGDHNPRHGGQFFMASDQWHHVEGTHPVANLFRLYFYDNFTKALAIHGIQGRIFSTEEAGREVDAIKLVPSRDGSAMEAPIKGDFLPRRVTAKVRFSATTPEERFDFTFAAITHDVMIPDPRTPASEVSKIPESVKAAQSVVAAISSGAIVENGPPWPGNISDVLTVLKIRRSEVLILIDQGNFASIYAPALVAKDLALAVADHLNDLPVERRDAMLLAVRRVVLAAWKLDRLGDLGDRLRLVEGYEEFALAVSEMELAYAGR